MLNRFPRLSTIDGCAVHIMKKELSLKEKEDE